MEKKNKIFVVNWAEYDENMNSLTSGQFENVYSTLDKAHAAVMEAIRDSVKDATGYFDESEWEEVYGTKDFEEIVKKFIVSETMEKFNTVVANPVADVETHYDISCYDLDQVV